VLSKLAIENLRDENEDIWKQIMIELKDAGLDTEVILEERPLITSWLRENISNGGFEEQSIADSASQRTASPIPSIRPTTYNSRQTWDSESLHSLARLLPESLVYGSQNPSNISVDRASLRSLATSTTTIRSPPVRNSETRILDSNEIRVEIEKLRGLVSSETALLAQEQRKDLLSKTYDALVIADPEIAAIMNEEQLKAIDHENNLRAQRGRFERWLLPLPWGWKWSSLHGLYENNITSDVANSLPLLDTRSFIVMSHELLPRCIVMTGRSLEILKSPHFQLDDIEDPVHQVKLGALRLLDILVEAMSKFDLILGTPFSTDDIDTQIMLLKEFGVTENLPLSGLEQDLLLAKNIYSALIWRILSLLHSLSGILKLVASFFHHKSTRDQMVSSWQENKMAERTALLKRQVDNEETWILVKTGLVKVWSWYYSNRQEVEIKAANIASFWSGLSKTTNGDAGDKITIKIHSAMSLAGEQLERRHLPLDRIGAIIAVPFVPLDEVCLCVRVLVDGVLLYQTDVDYRVSLISRFSWDTTRIVLIKNCKCIKFEIWDRNAILGLTRVRRQRALAVGRMEFKSPMSASASLDSLDLHTDINSRSEYSNTRAKC
jgi:hypothetical protein